MTTLAESLGTIRRPWQWLLIGGILLAWVAVAISGLHQSRTSYTPVTEPGIFTGPVTQFQRAQPMASVAAPKTRTVVQEGIAVGKGHLDLAAGRDSSVQAGAAAPERRVIRTSSMEMVVQHPAEVIDQITALAASLGGYLATSDSGGPDAMFGSLTVRVPASRFEEARAEIRRLGLRTLSEKVDAQDVTRQYVDRDATLRNLRAEEVQYLAILKQAHTVKDLLAVSGALSEVRGQIEQQQAEFNALSQQIDTVAIAISLRTESETQAFGLSWRPLYQIKMALRDGLESVAVYAKAMMAIAFYLPATILWLGTILAVALGSWRVAQWAGRRWLGWKVDEAGR